MNIPEDVGDRIERLAGYLGERGYLSSGCWRTALREVPRHLFVPARSWVSPDVVDGESYGIDRGADPARWWDAVYSDAVIVTQADDGEGDPATGKGNWTSSISAPGIVFAFLELLDVHEHHRVLEIGTGSGWTAALLAYRVGARNVTSIEIDPEMASLARSNLAGAGVRPHLILGDGAAGCPDRAPYDRVHVTCGVREIPGAWIAQARPGAVIVLPWMPGFARGHQTRLIVTGDGTAIGRFTGQAGYMMMRAQRFPDLGVDGADKPGADRRTTTRLDPRTVAGASAGAAVAVAARLPDVVAAPARRDDGAFELRLRDRRGLSSAIAVFTPGGADYDVRQSGDRRLWEEAVDAYLWWVRAGCPDSDRFGMTVGLDRQSIWLDDPGNTVGPG
jgi:protein-L-isoaspartate(D-aspartate) O-methyltransferase